MHPEWRRSRESYPPVTVMARKKVPADTQTDVLTRSRRRCCFCYFVDGHEAEVQGQIAHLDHDPNNNDLDNLAYLCLRHHDRYDSTTSVSKGLSSGEVKHYRERLYAEFESGGSASAIAAETPIGEPEQPEFLEYLDGLSGDELYRLAGAVLRDRQQSINFYRNEPIASVLVKKEFLERVPIVHTLQEMSSNIGIPFLIPNPVWRYLNENKRWLLDRTIERNGDRQDRLTVLRALPLE